MLSKSVRFSLTVAAIYLAWVLLSGMALAFTPMGSTWIYALNGLLLGLMPLAYQLTCGTRPRSPQPIALAGGLTALIATILCVNYLDEIYAGSTRLIALTAGYLIGLCWYGDSRRAVALTAVGALVAAAVGAWLLYGLQGALTTGMAAHSLNMRLPLYFATAVALLLGLALPLPRLARRVHRAACDSRGTACRTRYLRVRIQRGRAQRLCVILRQSRAGAQDQLRVLPVRRHSRHAVKAAVDHSADRQSVRVKGRAGAPG